MLIADLHADEVLEEPSRQMICEALDKYTPDLVVYLGDNAGVDGYDGMRASIASITEPVRQRGIPYEIVFGNHDPECGISKETLLEIYREFG